MQRLERLSECVSCGLRVADADHRVACPRCGGTLLALPDHIVRHARPGRLRRALARLRRLLGG